MERKIKTIGVVGAGTMGSGIAQLCAQKGFRVILVENNPTQLLGAVQKTVENLNRLEEKEKITKVEKSLILGRISFLDNLSYLSKSDYVIEAVFENKEIKQDIFRKLDKICSEEIVLASNTSTIPISQIAKNVRKKTRVIGMHFMNPATLMPLVEIIRAKSTSERCFRICWSLCESLDKTPIESKKDSAGFIANRILFPSINEAVFALAEGLGDAESLDKVMEVGGPYKMGPLRVADLIGLDVCLNILEILYREFRNPKFKPCLLWKEYIQKGWLGRKSGKGFYEYK